MADGSFRHIQAGESIAESAQVAGVACLLLAIEAAGDVRVTIRPLARLGDCYVSATVMIDVGDGPLPFVLDDVRLVADALRADPPFPAAPALADRLSLAVDQARTAALNLVGALN